MSASILIYVYCVIKKTVLCEGKQKGGQNSRAAASTEIKSIQKQGQP